MFRAGFITVLLFLLSWNVADACGGNLFPSYGGSISYTIDSGNPLKVNFTIVMYFQSNEAKSNDSIAMDWDDGLQSAIYASSIDSDSIAFANYPLTPLGIYRHTYVGSHTYDSVPASGYYLPWVINTVRPAGLVNVNYGDEYTLYILEAQVGIDTSAGFYYTPPIMPAPDLLLCTSGQSFTTSQLISVPKGDSVSCQLITPLIPYECGSCSNISIIPCQVYALPSQWCSGSVTDSSFAINSNTGVITWPGPICYDTYDTAGEDGSFTYDIAIRYDTYRNGKLIGSVMKDQDIYTIVGNTSAITETKPAAGLMVYPNPTNSQLNITLPDNTNGQISLYDVTGREVLSNKATNSTLQTIDISNLPQGAYLVTYQSAGGLFTQKVIKQ